MLLYERTKFLTGFSLVIDNIESKEPSLEDTKKIYKLVKKCTTLDLNSEYCYMLLATDFQKTCAISQIGQDVVGFVSGYIKPGSPGTLFVWQVAVDPDHRGKQIAHFMMTELLSRPHLSEINLIEATVSPSNFASQKLFEKIARTLNTSVNMTPYISDSQFTDSHESEDLYTVGPFHTIHKSKE